MLFLMTGIEQGSLGLFMHHAFDFRLKNLLDGIIQSIISGAIDVELLMLKSQEHRTPQNISLCRGTGTSCRHLFSLYVLHWFLCTRNFFTDRSKKLFFSGVLLSC